MAIKGDIESIYLSSILQLLSNEAKTGVLRIWDDRNEVTIYFNEGVIVYAKSNQKKHRLGYLLRSKGLVAAEALLGCLQLAQHKQQSLGKTLVEKGLITKERLQEFMIKKVQYTLYHLFLWKKGRFEFIDTPLRLDGYIMIRLNTLELILEASRRADETSEQKKQTSTLLLESKPPDEDDEGQKTITLLPNDET